MNKSKLELTFPFEGINKNNAQSQQVPLTSPAMANVRPCDSIQSRIRGGQRPGLKKQYQTCIGSGKPVVAMAEVTVVEVS
jgi:hypothetical protein